MPPSDIAAEKYDSFSGVLTISIDENLTQEFPGLRRWLTEITEVFEKRNKGVYLRIADSPQADLILSPIRSADNGSMPIAAGGYLLGVYGEPPASLDILPDASIGFSDGWETLWLALCEQFSPISTEKRTISAPDIGLQNVETPVPTSSPTTGTHFSRNQLRTGDPDVLFRQFLAGEIRAMPLSEKQVAKILSGDHDDVYLLNAASYTDRIICASIQKSPQSDAERRAETTHAFLDLLLADESQQKLAKYNLFSVAAIEPLYSGAFGMIEESLRRSDCVIGPKDTADFAQFLAGDISAREAMRRLRNLYQ